MPRFALLLLLLVPSAVTAAEDWKPVKGPLMTRWAKDVTPDNVLPEYPRPQMMRERWQSLNGLWQFAEIAKGAEPAFGKDLASKILVPFPVESALSGVMKPLDRVVYRRTFEVPKDWAGSRVLLHFGAVNWESSVWVNGKKLTTHQGGYDPFSVDVTDALTKAGPQELIVTAFNPVDAGPQPRGKQVRKPGGIYYVAATGIWQTVWLEPVPFVSVASLKITPDIDKKSATLVVNLNDPKKTSSLQWNVKVGSKLIAHGEGLSGTKIEMKIPSPMLWSPESPFLYDLDVKLVSDKGVFDGVASYFGMRKSSLGKDDKGVTRIFLNNKPSFQVGLLDQGYWPDGIYTAPTDAALKYDIEVTKKLGFNMARKHVKVEPARWYYWADKLGLIVWQDMPSGEKGVDPGKGEITRSKESAAIYERELARMMETLHNVPSIVLWVPFNEGWGQYDTRRITRVVKETDPSRLVTNASGWNDMECGDTHDIHVYPGPASPKPTATRAAVLGEFGGLGLSTPGHMWTKEFWGYRGVRDKAELTRKYERMMREVYKLRANPGLSAMVYTQTTDVETEANGFLTYDRAVVKVDVARVAAVNTGDFAKVPEVTELVADSRKKPQTWRYLIDGKADGWHKADFDDATWKSGPGGFGSKGTPGGVIGTEWTGREIVIRREFTLDAVPTGEVLAVMHHDEDAEVYINGVLALKTTGFTTEYEEFAITPEARKALKVDKNVIAVRCKQTAGGQYIDVGLAATKGK